MTRIRTGAKTQSFINDIGSSPKARKIQLKMKKGTCLTHISVNRWDWSVLPEGFANSWLIMQSPIRSSLQQKISTRRGMYDTQSSESTDSGHTRRWARQPGWPVISPTTVHGTTRRIYLAAGAPKTLRMDISLNRLFIVKETKPNSPRQATKMARKVK